MCNQSSAAEETVNYYPSSHGNHALPAWPKLESNPGVRQHHQHEKQEATETHKGVFTEVLNRVLRSILHIHFGLSKNQHACILPD
jgi:hypothetical protein